MQNRTTQVELLSALLKSILFLFLQTSVWYCSYRENGTKGSSAKVSVSIKKYRPKKPTTLLKRDSNKGVFLWNLRNF